jgi:S-adenosylmethionine decarboxylase
MDNKGRHAIADAYLVEYPGDAAIMQMCEMAIKESRMNVVSCTHKQFSPHGLTAVWILEESHFSLHTYPEHKYLSVDCYTCGSEGDPLAAISYLLGKLNISSKTRRFLNRGESMLEA